VTKVAKGRAVFHAQSAVSGPGGSARAFKAPIRLQTSFVSARERVLLDELCRRAPAWITPDRLTAIGSAGAAITALGYIGTRWSPTFLVVASLGLVLNWLGDSLDGSLARHRRIERARFGYFLDHSIDALNILVIAVGLGLTPYVNLAAALMMLAGYYLLTIHVLLSAQVIGEFPLTKAYLGPTELRIITIAFNCAILAIGPLNLRLAGYDVSIWSALVVFEAVVFIALFAIAVFATARRLARDL